MSTATSEVSSRVFVPGLECVKLNFTSGDTYKSKKFKKILGITHCGLSGSTSQTTDSLIVAIGTSDTSTVTLMSNSTGTSLTTYAMIWGIR